MAAHLAQTLGELAKEITEATAPALHATNPQALLKITQLVHRIEQANTDTGSYVGDPSTVARVKNYMQEASIVLSTPGASIMGAVAEDAKEGPNTTTHLETVLATFASVPFARQNLVEELNGIAKDIQPIRPRQIG